jgi:SAM-dependent methyltransferase
LDVQAPSGGSALFTPLGSCLICAHTDLRAVHRGIFDLHEYQRQDPPLAAYTGQSLTLVRCTRCGFGQPEGLPALPRYFERMYDQEWSADWIASEFDLGYKDRIFAAVLDALARRVSRSGGALLDVGAHVGRFIHLAAQRGWRTIGVETNARTAAFAARRTGGTIVPSLDAPELDGHRFDAVTLIDVLEHLPQPLQVLQQLRERMTPGGWLAVKVPHGPHQLTKELWRARLQRGYRATVADNLVHVNHFSPLALRLAMERAGFTDVALSVAPPERFEGGRPLRRGVENALRVATWRLARALPFAVDTPLALHLLAYARRRE